MRTYPIKSNNITRKYQIIYKFPSHLQAQNLEKSLKSPFISDLTKTSVKLGGSFLLFTLVSFLSGGEEVHCFVI